MKYGIIRQTGKQVESYNVECFKVRTLGIPDEKGATLSGREVEEGPKC